jgi:hypothetical protein
MPTLLAVLLAAAAAADAPGPSLEACRAADVRLVAMAGTRAFVTCGEGPAFEAAEGSDLADGSVERVETGALHLTPARVLRLFENTVAAQLPLDPRFTGERIDVDFEGSASAFAWLVGQMTGLNVVVEGDLETPVRVTARATPWDAAFAQALSNAGLGYELERGGLMRIGRKGESILGLPDQSEAAIDARPISFRLYRTDPVDVLRVYEKFLGIKIQAPPPPHPALTMYLSDVPANDAFLVVLASRRWRYRFLDDKTIEIGAIPPPQ